MEKRSSAMSADRTNAPKTPPWVIGKISTRVGDFPQVSAELKARDIIGTCLALLGINRNRYRIPPGLYGIGSPDERSPVFVTANYKMSFDRLRKELKGLPSWVMVLDTKGINVWCAAGKGTFGTEEVIRRVAEVRLPDVVSHRTLILPQLGASGVAAHEVTRQSRFKVIFGPVRARDIPAFMEKGMKATPDMRAVRFNLSDRASVALVDLVRALSIFLIFFGIFAAIFWIASGSFPISILIPFLGAIVVGIFGTAALLPWIPGPMFFLKGWLLGIFWSVALILFRSVQASSFMDWKHALSYVLVLPALSAFLAMNLTGSSTYTSLSGVVREMRIALPVIVGLGGSGVVFTLITMFVKF